MSLNLKINQRISLQDTQANPLTPALFDVPFCLNVDTFTNYITGDKEILNAGQSITLAPTFVTQFIMITSTLFYDVTVTQPAYSRTILGSTSDFPATTYTVTTQENTWVQFGIFSQIVITSRQNGNKFRWFVLGNDAADLNYIALTNSTFTTQSSPALTEAATSIPIFNVPYKQFVYVVGDGPVTMTANPSLQAGYYVNQQVSVVGTNNTNTVTINNGDGMSQNGSVTLGLDDSIDYYWTGTYWNEENRR